MQRIFVFVLIVGLAGIAAAQPYMDGFELTDYWGADGYRVFFDSSVAWTWGGTLQSPVTEFYQLAPMMSAWLVLVDPSAAELGGFRIGRRLDGTHVLTAEEVLGAPLSVQIVDDVVSVGYDPALPLDGSPISLIRWDFINWTMEPVAFYLWPAPGDEHPAYLDGAGNPIVANTHNGWYYDYSAPTAILNGGVTPNESESWGSVKALFR